MATQPKVRTTTAAQEKKRDKLFAKLDGWRRSPLPIRDLYHLRSANLRHRRAYRVQAPRLGQCGKAIAQATARPVTPKPRELGQTGIMAKHQAEATT